MPDFKEEKENMGKEMADIKVKPLTLDPDTSTKKIPEPSLEATSIHAVAGDALFAAGSTDESMLSDDRGIRKANRCFRC